MQKGSTMAAGDAETPSRFDPYGPNANADETRQAQHSLSNDAPVDINFNSIIARSQAQNTDQSYRNFLTNQDLRDKMVLDKLKT